MGENVSSVTEETTMRTQGNCIHNTWLKINYDCMGNIFACANLDGDPLELKVVITLVDTILLNAVLIQDNFPKLDTCREQQR